MMRFCFFLLFLVFANTGGVCQFPCATLGEIKKSIASCKIDTTLQLSYKKHARFDFFNFEAIDGVVNENDFVEVGRDKRGEIKEIVRQINIGITRRFKFKVFDFEKYKIMLLQERLQNRDAYFFFPSVFIVPKFNRYDLKGSDICMVTFDPVGERHHSFNLPATWDTSPNRFTNFITFSILDHNLYTKVEYMLSQSHVFLKNQYSYSRDGSGKIETKFLEVFAPTEENSKMKFEDSTCLNEVESLRGAADWEEVIYPRIDKKTGSLPLCLSSPH